MNTIHKILEPQVIEKSPDGEGLYRFVISTEDKDLVGDIVVQSGISPVSERLPAQVDHSGRMEDMIGSWKNFVTKGKKTFADLKLFERGLSKSADLVRALLEQKIQLAASIGFVPVDKEYEFLDGGGIKFLKTVVHETSVVVVPANPYALSIVKGFGIDPEALRKSAPKPSYQTILRAHAAVASAARALRSEP